MQTLQVLFALSLASAAHATVCNPKSCSKEGDVEKPVCGSDGLTYPNRCIFEKARCLNRSLSLARRGPCRPLKSCRDFEPGTFNASCTSTGSFDSVQCHQLVGYCWCVTQEGIPLPYTSLRRKPGAKPRCGRRKSNKRRSPSRKHRNKICKQPDRALFNSNLIESFHEDWIHMDGGEARNDSRVISWKFESLDVNNDLVLDKVEFKDLKRIVKRVVKPKRCAKSFAKACDVNNDQLISKQEWQECLSRDGMDDGHGQPEPEDSGEDGEDLLSPHRTPPEGVLTAGASMQSPIDEDDVTSENTDDPTDCAMDRKTALAEEHQLYVPDCTPDGRYQKIQCYKSAGYCWCVHEDTGKNIPGTSVKNGTPNCNKNSTLSRPMKGCSDEKKAVFLKELLHFLHVKMTNSTSIIDRLTWNAPKEEQAATWSFVIFDKNKNKMLEKVEWKAFKDMVATTKGLKKCGKKLPRYCDINKDRQISMTEWLDCLNVQQGGVMPTLSTQRKKGSLSLLRED